VTTAHAEPGRSAGYLSSHDLVFTSASVLVPLRRLAPTPSSVISIFYNLEKVKKGMFFMKKHNYFVKIHVFVKRKARFFAQRGCCFPNFNTNISNLNSGANPLILFGLVWRRVVIRWMM
jgi:hypothetical protein